MKRKYLSTLVAWLVIPLILAVLLLPVQSVLMDNDAALAAADGVAFEVAPGSEMIPMDLQGSLLVAADMVSNDRTIVDVGALHIGILVDSLATPAETSDNNSNYSLGTVLILSALTALVVATKSMQSRLRHYHDGHDDPKAQAPRGGADNKFILPV